MNQEIGFLMRVFKEKVHAEEFMKGNIRFGKLQNYKNESSIRKDKNESIVGNFNPLDFNISFNDINLSDKMNGFMKMNRTCLNKHYICCFSAMKIDRKENICFMPNRKRLEEFGEYIVCIHKPSKFKEKIQKKFKNSKEISLIGGEINYKNFKTTSFLPNEISEGFIKDIEYEGENEYRLKINKKGENSDYIYYNLGDLNDVAIMGKFKDLKISIKDILWK